MGAETGFTLQQLRIFWTIASSPSLTYAAKDLGITQPSLSQHLAKLEQAVGGRLFDRGAGQLILTDAGRYLLERAEQILADTDETRARLAEYLGGERGRIAIGLLPSVGRALLPPACAMLARSYPDIELDVHELPPLAAVDQLYGRNLQVAILSANSVAANRLTFSQTPVMGDPYLLAVPRGIDLAGVTDPASQLDAETLRVIRRIILFDFGTHHNQRTEEYYRRLIPRHHVVARCRTYETALALVAGGHGTAIVPQLACEVGDRSFYDNEYYLLPIARRNLVALLPSQYSHVQPFRTLIDVFSEVGKQVVLRPVNPPPPFVQERLEMASA